MFNFNPDYPAVTKVKTSHFSCFSRSINGCSFLFLKNDCWYRTEPLSDIGPFPISWITDPDGHFEIQKWFPLPSNLINRGDEWIPEVQKDAIVCTFVLVRFG